MSRLSASVLNKIDTAVLLAVSKSGADILFFDGAYHENTLALDNPPWPENLLLSTIHTFPEIRRPLLGTSVLSLHEDIKLLLIKGALRRLVKKGKIEGFYVIVPTLLIELGRHTTKMARRYRLLGPLEALARL